MQQNKSVLQQMSLVHGARRSLGLIFCVLLMVAFTGGLINALTNNYLDAIYQRQVALNKGTDNLLNAMINQETGLRGYISTANPIFLEPFYQGQRLYHAAFTNLSLLLDNESFSTGQQQLRRVDRLVQAWSGSFARAQIQLIKAHNLVTPRSIPIAERGKKLFDRFRRSITHLQILIDEHITAQKIVSYQLTWGSFSVTIVLLSLSIALSWMVFRRGIFALAKEFTILQTVTSKFAEGDLQASVPLLRYVELAQIESERQLGLLIEATPQMVWIVSPQGAVEYCNRRWYDYAGLTPEHRQDWLAVIYPDDRERYLESWRAAVATGDSVEMECRLKNAANGSYRWHQARAQKMEDQEGQNLKWLLTMTDIDTLKRAELNLLEINQGQLSFISTAGHEFRTALTNIQGFSELLASEVHNTEEVREYAGDINEEACRLRRIIDDMLDLEKMRQGKMILHKEAVEINALLQEEVAHMSVVSHCHQIRYQLDERIPAVEADKDKLIQVVTNLLSNAIKYSPDGGEILVSSRKDGEMVSISIQDHGIGIPPEAQEEIFLPYNRLHRKETHYIHGTGLGLAIVRQIVNMHGGKVWVESAVKQGSIFHLTLPLTPVAVSVGKMVR